jgi:hypothetical protein
LGIQRVEIGRIDYGITVIINVSCISDPVRIRINVLGSIEGKCIILVRPAITVIICVSRVPNTIAVSVGCLCRIEWEMVQSIWNAIQISIDVGLRFVS